MNSREEIELQFGHRRRAINRLININGFYLIHFSAFQTVTVTKLYNHRLIMLKQVLRDEAREWREQNRNERISTDTAEILATMAE